MAEIENGVEILENQLHQQYAENDNKRSGTFTSFIVGIIALFGSYGYVFVNTNTNDRGNWNFKIEEFLLMSFITIGILSFLAILALNFGYSLRRDQFIVFNIRKERYKAETEMEKIFGKLYSPFWKKRRNFLPDFYNLFYRLFLISEIFLGIITIKKIICIFLYKSSFFNCKNMICLILFFISFISFIILTLKFRCCYYKKYKKAALQCLTQMRNGK